ncbi:uncharacterized protein TNCV_1955451 [Trichonephila clavipes]|nr:uncharacterized protein TNCV_1955451 [Trichonephila clavipes]
MLSSWVAIFNVPECIFVCHNWDCTHITILLIINSSDNTIGQSNPAGVIGAVVPTKDGATCPTARATIDLLKDTFGDRLISRFGPMNWPRRSCDLTPLDYFLWGYVKSLVYANKPQTLDHLEDNIRRVIFDIRPQMLEKVIENWTSRLDYIRARRGSPMPEIIFKIEAGLAVSAASRSRYGSARCWQQWIQNVECTVAEGQDVPGTQMIIVQSEDRHQQRPHRFNATYLPFQTSSAIKRNHKETTDRKDYVR